MARHMMELWKKKVYVVQWTLLILASVGISPEWCGLFWCELFGLLFARFCVLTDIRHSSLPFTAGRHCDSCPVLWSCAVYNLSFVPDNWEILLGKTFCFVDDCLGQQNLISSQGVHQAWNCLLKCASSPTLGKRSLLLLADAFWRSSSFWSEKACRVCVPVAVKHFLFCFVQSMANFVSCGCEVSTRAPSP